MCIKPPLSIHHCVLNPLNPLSEFANYLFFAGGIFKALGEHERANNYFFEASQIGRQT
jgi:hypothetical protein